MKKTLLLMCIALQTFCGTAFVHAQTSPDLHVTPAVIDEKVKPRDILKESIMVKNNSTHVLQLYPSVDDINSQAGNQGFTRANDETTLANSLANWIELSRGVVQLGPGEERAIPFIIRVNLGAQPNSYHALIKLTEGGTRAEADSKPFLGTVTVNVEVQADIKELLQLNKFTTDSIFFSGDDVLFNYQLQNIGNQNLQPKGQIHIYDRKGTEVAAVEVNHEGKTISPEQASQLASVWSAANGFGRYKALLTVDYGSGQVASVQDTVFFWVVPWKQMLMVFTVSLTIVVILALQFHNWLERRHLYNFAHAGLLNEDTIKKINATEEESLPNVEPSMSGVVDPKQKRRLNPFVRRTSTVVPEVSIHMPHTEMPQEHKSLKEVLHKEEMQKTYGGAIDLKQLRIQAKIQPEQAKTRVTLAPATKVEVTGNVISLKKNT